jgi:uncharacterized protein (TIRG00374 family)
MAGGSEGVDGEGSRGPVSRRTRLLIGAGILVGVLLFVWFRLDWRAVLEVVARADVGWLAVGVAAGIAGIACWGEALRHLLPPGARAVSRRRGFLVYSTGALVRNAIPLGYASSIAVLGYVYAREADVSMDRSLAAVSVAEFVNAIASTTIAVVGVLLLAAVGPSSPLVGWLAVGTLALVVAGAAALATLWYHRDAVERVVHWVASLLSGVADRLANGGPNPLSPDAVEAAIAGYAHTIGVVSARRPSVIVALVYSLLAWSAFVASLYVCGLAIGYAVPIPVAMVVVTIGSYATVLPLPGGLGGYELGVAGGIAVLAGIDVVTALAVTLLFRVCTYWIVIGVGVVASAVLSIDLRRLVASALASDRGEAGPADR